MARAKAADAGEVTSAGIAEPLTDDTGSTHSPARIGGPSFRTICAADGETWPCTFAADNGVEAVTDAPGTYDPSDAGPSIEGTNAHAIVNVGRMTYDELVASGLHPDAAAAIAAAQAKVDAEDEG